MRLTWTQPEDLVPAELATLAEQGADELALQGIAERWSAAGGRTRLGRAGASAVPASPAQRALARQLLTEMRDLEPDDPDEPDDWAGVVAQQSPLPSLRRQTTRDRIHGAWTGRAIGCLLGKPVEKLPREGIEAIATSTGNWPIVGYFTGIGLPSQTGETWPWNRRSAPNSLAENIAGMPEDDDLNFAILALEMLEQFGTELTTQDVAQTWLASLPGGRVFTAERIAYRNLLDGYLPPETATRANPFREWIGAMIRADVYGWANPGDLASAARLAWVDAGLSHTRNGRYAAMWAAALGSAALVGDDVDQVLDAAQTVIPANSRLAAAINAGRSLAGRDLPQALDELADLFPTMHWVHSLNNAALAAYALAAGAGNLTPTIAAAVAGGWDTDSVGATVGGVVGALRGSAGIDPAWSTPLQGRISTSLPGPEHRRIDELAERTYVLGAQRD
ncbi:MAG: ADP-ribosylglycohydrolase family protein [Beutenbergiaceae bacterium]